jgi:hypothetical protein
MPIWLATFSLRYELGNPGANLYRYQVATLTCPASLGKQLSRIMKSEILLQLSTFQEFSAMISELSAGRPGSPPEGSQRRCPEWVLRRPLDIGFEPKAGRERGETKWRLKP